MAKDVRDAIINWICGYCGYTNPVWRPRSAGCKRGCGVWGPPK